MVPYKDELSSPILNVLISQELEALQNFKIEQKKRSGLGLRFFYSLVITFGARDN